MIDLRSPRRIHIIGLGGAGMSAIAEILIGTGHTVSGSDLTESAPLTRLAEAGVATFVGHHADQVGDVDVVAISTAIPETNPEVVAALERSIPVLRRAEILAAITAAWQTVSVAGTHGKTTTSAMLTAALQGAGVDPAFIVGGDLRDLGRGAAVGSGEVLVVEADESDGTFVELHSAAVIVTNVEPDHLEHYGGFEGLEQAFVTFISQTDGPRVICIDDPGAATMIDRADLAAEVITYGTSPQADWRIVDALPTPSGISFSVESNGGRYAILLRQPGMHNARNATAALAMASSLGADAEQAAAALSAFGGVGRRFENRGEVDGIRLVDDYAHLPTEVEAALAAARSTTNGRVVTVFQPHRYSRTEQLWSSFTNSFGDTDLLVITGIYSSGEKPRPGITGRLIADDVQAAHPDAEIRYVESLDDVATLLLAELRSGDLLMTLGAGDLTTLPTRLVPALENRSVKGNAPSSSTSENDA